MNHRLTAFVPLVLVLLLAGPGRAAEAQDTRAAELRAEREAKAAMLQPARRSGLEGLLFRIEDDALVTRLLAPPRGFHLRLGGVGEGAGFGVGPGYRYTTGAFAFSASAAGTIKRYGIAEASLLLPGDDRDGPFAALHVRRRDFPQQDFFGLGPDSDGDDRSNYALRDTLVSGAGGVRAGDFTAGARIAYLDVSIGRGTDTRMPSTEDVFNPSDIPGLLTRPTFTVVEPFAELDYADPPLNPTTGGRYRVTWSRHSDRELDRFSFDRWDVDLRQYVPLLHRARTLALRAWLASATPDDGHEVPFFLQPTLGGGYTMRGFRTFRFTDRSAAVLQAEYRWRINEFVTGALFYETGAVARRIEDLDSFEKDYGFGLRVGSRNGVAFRADVVFGSGEGTRLLVRFDNVF